MDIEECILTRRSVRKYKSTKVDIDKIAKILEAGRNAPSCGNVQNWVFIVVDDEDKKKAIAEACFEQYWIAQAPAVIVISAKPEEASRYYGIRGERLYTVQNAACAAENMILMAHGIGLSSCFVSAFDEDKIKGILGIVKEARPQVVLPIGYANEKPDIPSKYKLDNVAFINQWFGRIRDINAFLGYSSSAAIRKAVGHGKKALEKAKKKLQR
jgi:nitroreductase